MTEPSTSTSVLRLLPAAGAARCTRFVPATAAGLLTALAVGASVLLLPTGDSAAAAGLVTAAPAAQRVAAAGPALLHPVQPEQAPPAAAAQPVRQARDPFRPLLAAPDQATSAPAGSPTVSTPDSGAPAVEIPTLVIPDFDVPDVAQPPRVPSVPDTSVPTGSGASVTSKKLELTKVEVTGESFVAVLAIDGQQTSAKVGDSFGPGGQLLLLSLQQGPRDSQWTAVVQAGRGEPFDVVSGTPTRIP